MHRVFGVFRANKIDIPLEKVMAHNEDISIDLIYIDFKNPRYLYSISDEANAIETLCREEDVYELAKDISKVGLNPMDLSGVIQEGDIFIAAEGNRRLCAIKLLNDPELAPAHLKSKFKALSEQTEHAFDTVSVIVFEDRDEILPWLERFHGDPGKGVARKRWSTLQRQRFSNSKKNRTALLLVDYVVERGFYKREDFNSTLTTIQRFLRNEVFRNAIGLIEESDQLLTDRKPNEFEILVRSFMNDIFTGLVNSRTHNRKQDLIDYANQLPSKHSVGNDRVEPVSISALATHLPSTTEESGTARASKSRKIHATPDIREWLLKIKNQKIQDLYTSICLLRLDQSYNVPLATIGCWTLMESLSAMLGRNSNTTIDNFYSKEKLKLLGITDRGDVDTISTSLRHLREYANITKHHARGAHYNMEQLIIDMECLEPLIKKTCIKIHENQTAS